MGPLVCDARGGFLRTLDFGVLVLGVLDRGDVQGGLVGEDKAAGRL